MVRPDIFLGAHAEWFNYEQKRDRARRDRVQAWVNPEEYRQFVAKQKRAFEDRPPDSINYEQKRERPSARSAT